MSFPTNTKDRIVVQHGEWAAVDRGGPYIDIHHESADIALDVVNAWDYDKGERRLPFDRATVRAELLTWIAEVGDDYKRELPFLGGKS